MSQDNPRQRRSPTSSDRKIKVNTYYGNRGAQTSKTNSPFQKKPIVKSSSKTSKKITDILILLTLIGCLIYTLSVNKDAKVVLNHSAYHPAADYTAFVRSKLLSFDNKNKITFNKDRLAADIKQEYPEVDSVNIGLPVLGQRPVVRIYAAKPAFYLNSEGTEYLLAANGVALGNKTDYVNPPSLITIKDESGFKVTKGEKIISDNDILFLQTLNAELNRNKISLKNLVLTRSPEEVNLFIEDANYYTKFFMAGNVALQTGQFLAARNTFKTQTPPSIYLDVRVAGKIFYK